MSDRGPVVAVIPARLGSQRLARKVLLPLAGRPVVLHVADAVSRAGCVDRVLVATDSPEVEAVVRAGGFECVLTRSDHPSGTDRVGEAVSGSDAAVVVNVQGDEPLVPPESVDRLVELLGANPWASVATLACPLESERRDDPNAVRVVVGARGRALYFSRAPVPGRHPARAESLPPRRHLGLYAYRRAALDRFLALSPSPLELQEGLEQLRLLEAGEAYVVGDVPAHPPGVDTEEDLRRCEAILASRRDGV